MQSEMTDSNSGTSRKGSRKAITPEQKAAEAELRNAEKEKAKNLVPAYVVQYQGVDYNLADLIRFKIMLFSSPCQTLA